MAEDEEVKSQPDPGAQKPRLSSNIHVTVDDYESKVTHGLNRDQLIVLMHDEGLSIVDSIKVVRWIYGMPLGEAKRVVATHPSWAKLSQKMDAVHADLIAAIENEND